jgi:hypothetical protein
MLFADLLADELDDFGLDFVLVEIDRRQPVLRGEKIGDLSVGDEPELREGIGKVLPGLFLLVLRAPELLEADELFADE